VVTEAIRFIVIQQIARQLNHSVLQSVDKPLLYCLRNNKKGNNASVVSKTLRALLHKTVLAILRRWDGDTISYRATQNTD
jgi:hypothetical protein